MRSLYWKIFFFFWLTLIIAMGAVVFLTGTIIDNLNKVEAQQIISLAIETVDIYEQKGSRQVSQKLKNIKRNLDIKAFVLDENNRPISRINLPIDWIKFTQPLTPKSYSERAKKGLHFYRVSSSSGRMYTFVAQVFREHDYQTLAKHLPALQLITVFLIVALFTAFLTWRITTPLSHLRKTTNAFAQGKLNARIGQKIINRKDEISQLGQAFNDMAERIGLLLHNQQRLFRDISHELRTPLARQQIAIELLARKLPNDKNNVGLERIEREIGRMNDLIDQVLTLLRLEVDEANNDNAPYDLDELLESLVKDANFEAQDEGKVLLTAHAEAHIQGDQNLTARAIENIIRNAMRYTGDTGKVFINLFKSQGYLEVVIADEGPGVPEASLKHLFEPFYRVESSRNQQLGGYGIGMAIAEQAIRVQGGTICARNREPSGLEVTIRLPIHSK